MALSSLLDWRTGGEGTPYDGGGLPGFRVADHNSHPGSVNRGPTLRAECILLLEEGLTKRGHGPMPDNNANSGDKPTADFSDVQGSSSSTAPADHGQSYTVQSGDSLSKIAKHVYGDANKWHTIFDANRDKIKNPDLIQPGQVLTLPPNA